MASETRSIELPTATERAKSVASSIRSSPRTFWGIVILSIITLSVIFGPTLTPYAPETTHPTHILEGPSPQFPLGTDHLGRDLLTRVLKGGQSSLALGFGSIVLSLIMGVPLGLVAGYLGGKWDEIIMRSMDVLMSIPTLLLGLLILAILTSNIYTVIFAIGVVYAPRFARVVRSATLEVKNQEFIEAVEAQGEPTYYILFGEILPNIRGPILVEGSIRFGFAILIGTSLSFLGLGTQPPAADWGYMVSVGREHIYRSPWFILWPSVILLITVFSVNLIGDGLRDVFDTRVGGEEI